MRTLSDKIGSGSDKIGADGGENHYATVRRAIKHHSGDKHVCGTARYVDDLPEPEGTFHLAPGWLRDAARGKITELDLEAVRSAPGVVAVLTADDIPGVNDCSPSIGDDSILADGEILFWGQVIFLVVARTRDEARRAARLARIVVETETPVVTVDCALVEGGTVMLPDYQFRKGQPEAALDTANKRLSGVMRIGGQEHFYLEGQVSLALPGEDGDMFVHSSTQHPSEVQHIVAKTLGLIDVAVTVEVRRMGVAFGGKESQANQWAALAASAANYTGQACKIRLDRDDDMIMTGKRHDFRVDYTVGFESDGAITAVDMAFAARCGYSADLTLGVVDRTMFRADSSYFYPDTLITSRRMRTNTCSNTAFRGFGGSQDMLAAERLVDSIAITLKLDPLDVRKRNFYMQGADVTPYSMRVEEFATQHAIVTTLEETSEYRVRREKIRAFNASNHILKKRLALTPVKFGISFTLPGFNRAGALVHLYQDGSAHLNHGGTEMGQGLNIKVVQVVAEEFAIPLDWVKITATHTGKVPNTAPTAASSGTRHERHGGARGSGKDQGTSRGVCVRQVRRARRQDHPPGWACDDRQRAYLARPAREGRRHEPDVAVGDRLLCHAEDYLELADGDRPPVPLFRLWGGVLGSDRRYDDRRDARDPRGCAARCRQVAQSGRRYRPDRRRLRSGHGLADDGGTGVGRGGPSEYACTLHLQDPDRFRRS